MKKILYFAALIAVIGIASCSNGGKGERDSIAELNQEYQEATSFNDSLLLLMGDIYTGLDSINTQEGLLYNLGPGENSQRRQEIRDNLSNIRARLAANRELLEKLEAQVQNSNSQNQVLSRTISQLKARIDQQEQKIDELQAALTQTREQLASANVQIDSLHTTVAQKTQEVESETLARQQAQQQAIEAENAANTVYYAIGTNKELKNNGLLEKKFLGQTKVMKGDFNAQYFRKGDKRELSMIPLGGKFDKIWTNAPAGSYEIVQNADKSSTLRILNPSKFWSLSNYLIIQIK